ncbi:DUF2301 domain-containing membrane protein [Conservatibacter flavescens]|uniref:Integral membrane protein n=1 Tax=Conservatibacter flavescens TaxID=28161 RepID=A0A2M8S4C1_9PAST|nr:DUF2301 domain-containing membrane protein [Conservatibacter flavescens]PJG85990.1 hypothetical protein CVP05_02150 [Conservatibacter flavescens]
MADPHIQSPMDIWDYLTVIIYRTGFVIATLSVALLPYYPRAELGILLAASCCASSLHIYLKQFRLLLQMATWTALILFVFGFPNLALDGAFVTLGGLCFKEYYCFRIPGLNAQSVFFALLWLCLQAHFMIGVQILSLIIAALLLLLSIQKWRMPLHFDIGDKRKYEV